MSKFRRVHPDLLVLACLDEKKKTRKTAQQKKGSALSSEPLNSREGKSAQKSKEILAKEERQARISNKRQATEEQGL